MSGVKEEAAELSSATTDNEPLCVAMTSQTIISPRVVTFTCQQVEAVTREAATTRSGVDKQHPRHLHPRPPPRVSSAIVLRLEEVADEWTSLEEAIRMLRV